MSSRIDEFQMLKSLGEAGEKVGDYLFGSDLKIFIENDNLKFIDDLLKD